MRFTTLQAAAIGSASLLFSAQPVSASLAHRHAHQHHAKRHGHIHSHPAGEVIEAPKVVARKAPCSLPDHPDLVRVPGADNHGFAMSPDEVCEDGKWCPLACVPGKLMAQWKPDTGYHYPESMVRAFCWVSGYPDRNIDEFSSTADCIATVERPRSLSTANPIAWTVRGPSRP